MKTRILTLLLLTALVFGSVQTSPTSNLDSSRTQVNVSETLAPAGFSSDNISIDLLSPINGSGVSGTFDIDLNITADNGPLNLTLFVEGAIYTGINKTPIGVGTNWLQNVTVDTTLLAEGKLNFTLLMENDTAAEKESFYLVYFVDNVSPNFDMILIDPVNGSVATETLDLILSITSDFDFVNLTVFIEGTAYTGYDGVLVPASAQVIHIDTLTLREGILNFTIVFDYDVINVQETYVYYFEFLVDNDDQPITLYLQSPTNNSVVTGAFNLTVDLASDYGFANLTVLVDGEILYVAYNRTSFADGAHDLELDTTGLDEGTHQFSVRIDYNMTGEDILLTYNYIFEVDNHGVPFVEFISPDVNANFTGMDDFTLNITSDYASVNLTIYVDGEIAEEYNNTSKVVGVDVYTINGSRYANGYRTISATVTTEEGLSHTAERQFFFIDYVFFVIDDITNYNSISGIAYIPLIITTPFESVNVTYTIDDDPTPVAAPVTLPPGLGYIAIDTTQFSEGLHDFTFVATAPNGYWFKWTIILEVDNHGIPEVSFLAPRDDIVVGLAQFIIEIDSTWDQVNITVYVDDEIVPDYNGTTIDVGEYTFAIDTSIYSKWEHTVKVVITTVEGETAEISSLYGFANFRLEEIVSLAIILVVAFAFPISRWRRGIPLLPVIIADILFAVVVAGLFIAVGINTLPLILWHLNIASIWAVGAALIATNWIVPLAMEAEAS
jgi:hypothetical protein